MACAYLAIALSTTNFSIPVVAHDIRSSGSKHELTLRNLSNIPEHYFYYGVGQANPVSFILA